VTPPPERLLLVQLHHMGDVLLCTPAIRAARQAWPDARIDFLTGSLGAQVLADNPHLNAVIQGQQGLGGWWRTRQTLRGVGYDAVVDFHSTPRTARWVGAIAAPVRVGIVGRGPRNRAYTVLHPREPEAVYMARQKLRLLGHLGLDTEAVADVGLQVEPGPAERAYAAGLFQRHALGSRPVVALSPVSRLAFKQWGAERWAAVGDRLHAAGCDVLVSSGPGEEAQAQAVAEAMARPPVWQYGLTSLRQLAAVYARCTAWIGNDGGPKHLAVAAGLPTVSVVRPGLGEVWNDAAADPPQRFFDPPSTCGSRCPRCRGRGCPGSGTAPDEVAAAALALAGVGTRRP
jgi:ADP-heptose:LPS heptosyltransferase